MNDAIFSSKQIQVRIVTILGLTLITAKLKTASCLVTINNTVRVKQNIDTKL